MQAVCGACTHENRPGSFFCSQCGTKLHFAAAASGHLRFMNGPQQDRPLDLGAPVNVLGRGPAVTLRLDDESVSKQHARLAFADGRWTLKDLDSSNGTFVNGRRVREATEVKPGDLLRLGAVILKLEN